MTSNQHYMPVQGTLTADPELKYLQSGSAVVNMSLAFNPRVYDRDAGEWKDGEATFFNCTAYGKLAEGIAAHPDMRRGKRALGYGRISTRTWDDKNGGGRRSRDEYILDACGPDVTFYADDQQRGPQGGGQPGSQSAPPSQSSPGGGWGAPGPGPQQGGQADPWAASAPQQGGWQWGQNPAGQQGCGQ